MINVPPLFFEKSQHGHDISQHHEPSVRSPSRCSQWSYLRWPHWHGSDMGDCIDMCYSVHWLLYAVKEEV